MISLSNIGSALLFKGPFISYVLNAEHLSRPYRALIKQDDCLNERRVLTLSEIVNIISYDSGCNIREDTVRLLENDAFYKVPPDFAINFQDLSDRSKVFLVERTQSPDKNFYLGDVIKLLNKLNQNIERYFHEVSRDEEDVDIVILYSDPLVEQVEGKGGSYIRPLESPLDFDSEYQKLKSILKDTGRAFRIMISIATLENFEKALKRRPKILHFICHGLFQSTTGGGYLFFEKENGELDTFDSNKISYFRDLLKSAIDDGLKLVFINSCFSEHIARSFQIEDNPVRIAIRGDFKISEEVAQEFSRLFYREIFVENTTINEAFTRAKEIIKLKKFDMGSCCCCAHSHEEKCPWRQYLFENGQTAAHMLHSPTCKCPKAASENLHIRATCQWMRMVETELISQTYDNCATQPLFRLSDSHNSAVGTNSDLYFFCCCKEWNEEMQEIHNRDNKFIMIPKDSSILNQPIFGSKRPKGSLVEINGPRVYPGIDRLFGRDLIRFKAVNHFSKKTDGRLVILLGQAKVGKKAIAKSVIKYVIERGWFKDGVEEAGGQLEIFLRKTKDDKANDPLELQRIIAAYERKEKLIYIRNLEAFEEMKVWTRFNAIMKAILEKSNPQLKFLFTAEDRFSKKVIGEKSAEVIHVPELSKKEAAYLCLSRCNSNKSNRLDEKKAEQLVGLLKDRKIPTLLDLVENLKENDYFTIRQRLDHKNYNYREKGRSFFLIHLDASSFDMKTSFNTNSTKSSRHFVLESCYSAFFLQNLTQEAGVSNCIFNKMFSHALFAKEDPLTTSVLHLKFIVEGEYYLVFEEHGEMRELLVEEVAEHIIHILERVKTKLLILDCLNGKKLKEKISASFPHRDALPCIIYFAMEEIDGPGLPEVELAIWNFLQDMLKTTFFKKFYQECLERKGLDESFERALTVFEIKKEDLNIDVTSKTIQKILKWHFVKVKKENFKSLSQNQILLENSLQSPVKKIRDSSVMKNANHDLGVKCNLLSEEDVIMLKGYEQADEIYNFFARKKSDCEQQNLNIVMEGFRDSNIEFLIKQIAGRLLRSSRFQDGIFYFDLCTEIEDFREKFAASLMTSEIFPTNYKEEWRQAFKKKTSAFFKERKNMLFIINNFDQFLVKDRLDIPDIVLIDVNELKHSESVNNRFNRMRHANTIFGYINENKIPILAFSKAHCDTFPIGEGKTIKFSQLNVNSTFVSPSPSITQILLELAAIRANLKQMTGEQKKRKLISTSPCKIGNISDKKYFPASGKVFDYRFDMLDSSFYIPEPHLTENRQNFRKIEFAKLSKTHDFDRKLKTVSYNENINYENIQADHDDINLVDVGDNPN